MSTKLEIIYLHAERRCAPCRDMSDRIKEAQARRPDLRTDAIRVIDTDDDPEQAELWGVEVVPTILLVDKENQEIFRSNGRITSAEFEALWQAAVDGDYSPAQFSADAPSAELVFYRTYSRRNDLGDRETWPEVTRRCVDAMTELGELMHQEQRLVEQMMIEQKVMPSGRWLWVGGTEWVRDEPRNYSGAYNCTSTVVRDPEAFGLLMDLAMMGSGTGAVLEDWAVQQLPKIYNRLEVIEVIPVSDGRGLQEGSSFELHPDPEADVDAVITVGDSRHGWVSAYQQMIDWMMSAELRQKLNAVKAESLRIKVDLSQVRGPGQALKGFGGTANPAQLPALFSKVARISEKAQSRQLTPVECCLLIDAAAACVVAGNIRRSAGMRQFSATDKEAAEAKSNLYVQDSEGKWSVDPEREDLRMANHTRVFHTKPSLEELTDAVRLQFHTGEGAIQYAPEAIARGSADLLADGDRESLIECIEEGVGKEFLCSLIDVERPDMSKEEKEYELEHRMTRYGLNPCGEIIGRDFHCNLSEVHLNTLDPRNLDQQEAAFRAAALQVCVLLHHQFVEERYQASRELDPIIGVSFTGMYDFFAKAFGIRWLQWMQNGRPTDDSLSEQFSESERGYLTIWRNCVNDEVERYCGMHSLRVPSRTTTVQPAGTKSLLTGASSGWHPPKAQRFIRRITTGREDPVALAAQRLGYKVIPAQSSRDERGALLDNIWDERVSEWLVEVPTQVAWAEIEGADEIDLERLPVRSQYQLYMQVQKHYTEHNTSATLELREDEIEELAELIHDSIQSGEGYISAALLARFDASGGTFPRLPFEPISKARYEKEMREVEKRRATDDFAAALQLVDDGRELTPQEGACTSAACIAKADKVKELSAGATVTGT